MLNYVCLMGRLTRDPELRRTSLGTAVASFSVAVDRDYSSKETGERETDFINCVAWRQTGEFVSRYFQKGSMIVVAGRLQMRKWVDNDGTNRVTYEVVANNVYFGESKKDKDARENNQGSGFTPYYGQYGAFLGPHNPVASDFAMLDDDDAQLPF